MSILCHAEIDGERLAEESLVMETLLILIGGDETTRHVISGGMHQLIAHPDQHEQLRRGEADLAVAVEEMLRWVTPIKNMNRTATCDIEIGGQVIGEGDQVLLFYPSANRDAAIFDEPFAFDISRDPNPGNALARLELTIMFETLFERLPDLTLAPDARLPVRAANFVVGFEGMPVVFTPTERRPAGSVR